jgi:hypothetical protein
MHALVDLSSRVDQLLFIIQAELKCNRAIVLVSESKWCFLVSDAAIPA